MKDDNDDEEEQIFEGQTNPTTQVKRKGDATAPQTVTPKVMATQTRVEALPAQAASSVNRFLQDFIQWWEFFTPSTTQCYKTWKMMLEQLWMSLVSVPSTVIQENQKLLIKHGIILMRRKGLDGERGSPRSSSQSKRNKSGWKSKRMRCQITEDSLKTSRFLRRRKIGFIMWGSLHWGIIKSLVLTTPKTLLQS